MKTISCCLLLLIALPVVANAKQPKRENTPNGIFHYSAASGIGQTEGVMRRDPSDIIKVGDLYYVWYSKGSQNDGYDSTVWYATSPDSHTWTERGEAVARGPQGSWDEQSVFTPSILVAESRYYVLFSAVPKPFSNDIKSLTKSAIGMAVSDSPDGPWKKLPEPVVRTSDNPADFDSARVDDACMIIREGKYWLYYKGRQWKGRGGDTKTAVAIAEKPEGPYVKHADNPVIDGGHSVVMWPLGKGVATLINTGPEGIARTLRFAPDGLNFTKFMDLQTYPHAPGTYRPEAFTGSEQGRMPEWGIHIRAGKKGTLPCLERYECRWQNAPDPEPIEGLPAIKPAS